MPVVILLLFLIFLVLGGWWIVSAMIGAIGFAASGTGSTFWILMLIGAPIAVFMSLRSSARRKNPPRRYRGDMERRFKSETQRTKEVAKSVADKVAAEQASAGQVSAEQVSAAEVVAENSASRQGWWNRFT